MVYRVYEDSFQVASVTFFEENETKIGEKADVFKAFFIIDGNLRSIHRRFRLLPVHAQGHVENWASDLVYTTYSKRGALFAKIAEKEITPGLDPRVVTDGTQGYIVGLSLLPEEKFKHEYKVIHLPSFKITTYQSIPQLPLGKNWQPFMRDGKLFIMHGFAPCAVYELKPDGTAENSFISKQGYEKPVSHDNYTIYRGGSNAIQAEDGNYYGYGHINFDSHIHKVFPWSMDQQNQVVCFDDFPFQALTDKGYNIHDVTSFFQHDDYLFMGVTLSERDWFHTQRFANILLKTPLNGKSVADVWNNPDKWILNDEIASLTSPVKTYFPCDSYADTPVSKPNGTIKSHGHPGQIYELLEPLAIEPELGSILELSYRALGNDQKLAFLRLSKYKHDKLFDTADFFDLDGSEGDVCTLNIPIAPPDADVTVKMNIMSLKGEIEILNIRLKDKRAISNSWRQRIRKLMDNDA